MIREFCGGGKVVVGGVIDDFSGNVPSFKGQVMFEIHSEWSKNAIHLGLQMVSLH